MKFSTTFRLFCMLNYSSNIWFRHKNWLSELLACCETNEYMRKKHICAIHSRQMRYQSFWPYIVDLRHSTTGSTMLCRKQVAREWGAVFAVLSNYMFLHRRRYRMHIEVQTSACWMRQSKVCKVSNRKFMACCEIVPRYKLQWFLRKTLRCRQRIIISQQTAVFPQFHYCTDIVSRDFNHLPTHSFSFPSDRIGFIQTYKERSRWKKPKSNKT